MLKHSKVYVAGHTGLLGSALIKKLREYGCRNIITKDHSELELTDKEAVDQFFDRERPEHVFLAAGKTGNIKTCATYPATFIHLNICIQDNVFEAANKHEVKHMVYYGSSCTYPKNSTQHIKEEYFLTGPIEETSDAYASAKIAGVLACKAYNKQYNTNRFIALIPNTMYGPNDKFSINNSHVYSALIRRFHDAVRDGENTVVLWGSGNQRREFIFSDDVADASIFMVNNAVILDYTHYNVGTGVDLSIRELALMIAKKTGFEGEIKWDTTKPDGPKQKLLDSTRILQLGWKSSVSLENGLSMTYKWFLENQN